ncbi:pilus assembly protein PilO [uncultured Candidatus Pelagibacter sp.]|jgi:Tfp pilus assembly protein PilO|uniref:pilus assembly protein PilO n=1 Tax=uncultured Candidatus Pelagibacter sp. TaxID=372654 RepID=UPI002321F338|nr:pilus assembly protein PilO [uncultured Candidatus Pelagibacter sp.]MDA8532699.1 pilus assembly protein PilO [Candidatus Pelagibacter bacterium]
MDLASLKDLDLNDIITKLKSGALADKKTLIKFGVSFVAILIFLIGYYAFVSPVVNQQKEQISLMNENKIKIEEFKNNIGTLTAAVKALEPDYAKNSKLFHSKKEVEDLYQNISKFALINGLSITNLKKGNPKGVAGVQGQSTEQTTENQDGQNVMYYTIPVEYEIQGNFLSYLKFRRALSKSQKVINFDKEEITTIAEIQGQILSKGTISIVGLPNEYK